MIEALKREIRELLLQYCTEPVHCQSIIEALSRPRYALSRQSSCKAGAFALEVHRAILGSVGPIALKAAAAVQLLMEAGFMFDHVADEELDPGDGLTPAEEMALAITTLSCGVSAAYEAERMAESKATGLKAFITLQAHTIASCSGQFLDAYLQKARITSTEESLKMTTLKSGSIGKLAAEFGAATAADDIELVREFGELGFNVFTYLQLVDDLMDAFPPEGAPVDLLQFKKTLPLVFFYNTLREANISVDDVIMRHRLEASVSDVRRRFIASGAWSFCTIVAETYLNRAKGNLDAIERRLGKVSNLEHLVGSIEIAAERIPLGA